MKKSMGQINNRLLVKKVLTVFAHSVVWGIFIFYPFLLLNIKIQDPSFIIKLFIDGIFLAAVFYFNMYYLIPKFYAKNKYLAYFGLAVFMLVIIFAEELLTDRVFFSRKEFMLSVPTHLKIEQGMPYRGDMPTGFSPDSSIFFDKKPPIPRPFYKKMPPLERKPNSTSFRFFLNQRIIGKAFSSGIIVLALSGFMKMAKEWSYLDRQKKELEKSKLKAELSLLKSQVNPHFLFNTLNSIYSLAHKKSEYTEKAIVKLSHLMRYMIYDVTDEFVPLHKEINHLENYVELQRLRLSEKMSVKFEVNEHDRESKLKVAPMLFIVLVENAFKHGISYIKPSIIKIKLIVTEKEIEFLVTNSITPQSKQPEYNGRGLENLTKRLQLIYPDKHQIKVEKIDNMYSALLKIQV